MKTIQFNKPKKLVNKFNLDEADIVCYLNGKAMSKENLETYMKKKSKYKRKKENRRE